MQLLDLLDPIRMGPLARGSRPGAPVVACGIPALWFSLGIEGAVGASEYRFGCRERAEHLLGERHLRGSRRGSRRRSPSHAFSSCTFLLLPCASSSTSCAAASSCTGTSSSCAATSSCPRSSPGASSSCTSRAGFLCLVHATGLQRSQLGGMRPVPVRLLGQALQPRQNHSLVVSIRILEVEGVRRLAHGVARCGRC